MAEAFTRALSCETVEARSADAMPGSTLNPEMAQAMAERGILLTRRYPGLIDQQTAKDGG